MRFLRAELLAALAWIAIPSVATAQTAVSKCDAARIRAAGKLAKVSLTCHAKGARRGEAVAGDCLEAAYDKFLERYAKATLVADCTQPALSDEQIADSVGIDVTAFAVEQRPQGDANACSARKIKGIATSALGLAKCEAVAAQKALPVDSQCTAKASTKLETAFAKAESKDPPCFTTGDAAFVLLDLHGVVGDLGELIYDPPSTPTPTRTGPPTRTGTPFTPTVSATPTASMTSTKTVTATNTGTMTMTPTPVVPCAGSAPICGGVCQFPAQMCEPHGAGGCRCVNIVGP